MANQYKLVEVNSTSKLKIFNQFVVDLYKKNPYYVPYMWSDEMKMLDPKFNLSLKDCEVKYVLCYDTSSSEVVGRIGVILQKKYNQVTNTNGVRFTRFDCINSLEVASLLFSYCEKFAKDHNANFIQGPFGFNETDRSGYLIEGFDKKGNFGTNYNYEYYDSLITSCGYSTQGIWVEADISVKENTFEKMSKLAQYVLKKTGYTICKEKTFKSFADKYGWKAFQCLNKSYSHLPGFVPFELDVYEQIAKQYAQVVKPEWLTCVINQEDDVIGFAICFPSLADAMRLAGGKLNLISSLKTLYDIAHPKIVDLCLIGVSPEYQGQGINTVLIDHILDAIKKHKIKKAQTYAMHIDNYKVLSEFKYFETTLTKKRKAVIKNIE
jgi:GNAT superfamily N-acetyltransferase